jgi:hypothetical protein
LAFLVAKRQKILKLLANVFFVEKQKIWIKINVIPDFSSKNCINTSLPIIFKNSVTFTYNSPKILKKPIPNISKNNTQISLYLKHPDKKNPKDTTTKLDQPGPVKQSQKINKCANRGPSV